MEQLIKEGGCRELESILCENLMSEVKKDLDVFDLICHIAWDMPALTRKERAEQVKKTIILLNMAKSPHHYKCSIR